MVDPDIPLITLDDGHAPYKGTWCLVQHHPAEPTGAQATALEAVHTTFCPERGPGCEIERLSFTGADPARQFVRHLLLHNWRVRSVHSAGEAFWIGLPS
jgi:hypothetical protein